MKRPPDWYRLSPGEEGIIAAHIEFLKDQGKSWKEVEKLIMDRFGPEYGRQRIKLLVRDTAEHDWGEKYW